MHTCPISVYDEVSYVNMSYLYIIIKHCPRMFEVSQSDVRNILTCGAESAPAAIAALLSARVFVQLPTFLASRHLVICRSTAWRLCISLASDKCLLALSIKPNLEINNNIRVGQLHENMNSLANDMPVHPDLLLSTWRKLHLLSKNQPN